MRGFQVPHERFRKLLAVEILSFVSLFGIAMGLLTYQRFPAAIVLFSLACATLDLSALILILSIKNTGIKWFLIVLTIVGAIGLTGYLMGVVSQAETDFYSMKRAEDIRISKEKAEDWRESQPKKVTAEKLEVIKPVLGKPRANAKPAIPSEMKATPVTGGPDFSRSVVDYLTVDEMTRHVDGSKATAIAIGLEIRNTGTESAITNYDETLITPDGTKFPGTFTKISQTVRFSPQITLSPDVALEPKTQLPISRGAIVKGWLLFDFNVLPQNVNVGSRLILHFEDVFGGEYTITQKYTHPPTN